MTEYGHKLLQSARSRSGKLQHEIAIDCDVSERTIQRWESGEVQPGPDDVEKYANSVGDPNLWHHWMLSTYKSYRRVYLKACDDQGLPAKMARFRYEMGDVMHLHDRAERDGLDGKIDDPQLKAQYAQEVQEALAAGADLLQELLK